MHRPPGVLVPLAAAAVLVLFTSFLATNGRVWPSTEHRIGVRVVDGDGEFYDRASGETFVPRGANLIRLDDYHNTFGRTSYDAEDLDAALAAMEAQGYNVVRVFLDQRPGALAEDGANGLSDVYIDNLVDFLRLAHQHGVYVMLTGDVLPEVAHYGILEEPGIRGHNINYLAANGIESGRRYFGDLVDALLEREAPMAALWAYELRNEAYYDELSEPFSLTSGSVTTANGKTYDLADPAERVAMMEEGMVFWVDQMRAEILEHDPDALVTAGFFVPQGPNPMRMPDPRIIETRAVIEGSALDFIDLHAYAGFDPLAKQLENFGLDAQSGTRPKPLVMAEFGAFRDTYPDVNVAARMLLDWQTSSCAWSLDGWLLWTWDAGGAPTGTWNATDADGILADLLSPDTRPDACSAAGADVALVDLAMNRPATASMELATDPASAAVDGSRGTIWNSGGWAPHWIEVDLGEPVGIGEIRLVVAQTPPGATVHRLYGASSPTGPMELLETFSGETADGDVLVFTPTDDVGPIQLIRVETVESPSWVAWRAIEVEAAGE